MLHLVSPFCVMSGWSVMLFDSLALRALPLQRARPSTTILRRLQSGTSGLACLIVYRFKEYTFS